MKITMHDNTTELASGLVGIFTYITLHVFGVNLAVNLAIPTTEFDIISKLINMVFGVITACLAFIAVHYLKKIFKEPK